MRLSIICHKNWCELYLSIYICSIYISIYYIYARGWIYSICFIFRTVDETLELNDTTSWLPPHISPYLLTTHYAYLYFIFWFTWLLHAIEMELLLEFKSSRPRESTLVYSMYTWSANADMCSQWTGVSCTADGNVNQLWAANIFFKAVMCMSTSSVDLRHSLKRLSVPDPLH